MRNNRTIFIAAGMFALAAGALAVLLVYPLFGRIQTDYARAVDKKQQLAQLQEDRARVQEFAAILVRHEQEFSQLDSLFLDASSPIAFFRFLDRVSAEFGLQLEKTPGTPTHKPGDPWPSMDVKLQGNGSFAGISAFLQKIEHGPYVLELRNVGITRSGEQTSFTASLTVYTKTALAP